MQHSVTTRKPPCHANPDGWNEPHLLRMKELEMLPQATALVFIESRRANGRAIDRQTSVSWGSQALPSLRHFPRLWCGGNNGNVTMVPCLNYECIFDNDRRRPIVEPRARLALATNNDTHADEPCSSHLQSVRFVVSASAKKELLNDTNSVQGPEVHAFTTHLIVFQDNHVHVSVHESRTATFMNAS